MNQKLITDYQLPITNYRLQITNHQSLKQILRLFEEALAQRAFIAITQLSKFLQFCLLCCREMRWHFDVYAHMQVAVAVTLDILDSLPFEPEHGSGLSAGWNFQGCFPVQRRHFDIVAQRRLNKAYRHFTKQIVAIALENFVRLNVKNDVKIT